RPLTATASPRRLVGLGLGIGLGLLALGPGLRRGFLLSYDMVIVPREPFTATMFGLAGGPPRAVPSDAVLAAASRIVPADIVQKLVLLSVFALACAGAAALLEREPWFARLAAGVFYAWNPFVAERLLIGQWALLLGYAGLPWALRAVIIGPVASWRGAGRLGLALLPAAVGGFAAMAISALVVVPAAVLAPGGPARRRLTSAAALAVLAVAGLPWLIPSALRPVYADPAGIAAFAARADTPFGSVGSLLMLGGVWNAQAVPAGYGGAWSVIWLALVLAAAAGYVAFGLRRHRWPGLTFAAVAGLAIASVGVTATGRGLLRAAVGIWPGFAVLWDAQQFVAPLALAEAVGAGLLVTWAVRAHVTGPGQAVTGREEGEHHEPRTGRPGLVIAVALVLAPVLLLPGLAWGAAGRLRPAWYPAAWLEAAQMIDHSPAQGAALLLPWAAYRRAAWNGGRAVLDPWPRLVSRQVIWNTGPQVGAVKLKPDDPAARRLGRVILVPGPLTAALEAAGVRFVIVDAGGSVSSRLPGCVVVFARPGLAIYQVPDGAIRS
ncbi:MAG TPA: hypothetical protein VN597_12730, partial [Streptosporangiaceae bacterium]|nr:hypothetical protein [Streptosporangiaceae bacterium]